MLPSLLPDKKRIQRQGLVQRPGQIGIIKSASFFHEPGEPGKEEPGSPCIEKVHHHLEDEEDDFFKKAKQVYSDEASEKLAKAYKKTVDEYRKSWPEAIPGK